MNNSTTSLDTWQFVKTAKSFQQAVTQSINESIIV